MTINELCQKAHANARDKGFWEDYDNIVHDLKYAKKEVGSGSLTRSLAVLCDNAIATRLMLVVSEVSEALEALRKTDYKNFEEELADVAIRLGDLCGGLGVNLEYEIIKKMEKNRQRGYKHGKAF